MKSHSRLLVLTADHSEVAEPDWCTGSRERRGHMLDLASGIAVRGLPWWIEEGYQDETAPRRTLRGQVFGGGFLLVDLHCPERSPAHRDGRVYSVLVMAQESEYPVGAAVANHAVEDSGQGEQLAGATEGAVGGGAHQAERLGASERVVARPGRITWPTDGSRSVRRSSRSSKSWNGTPWSRGWRAGRHREFDQEA